MEVLIDDRPAHKNGGPTRGEKRNALMDRATGDYVAYIDGDDVALPDYVNHALTAIRSTGPARPDVVTFTGYMTTDGKNRVDWVIKLGEKYEARQDPDGVTRYYRFPNHLAIMKRSIASQIRFQHIHEREDFLWADEIRKRGLLKTSYHVTAPQLYWYDFKTNK